MIKSPFFFLLITTWVIAQFDPQVGNGARFAIYKDSSVFKSWAQSAIIYRGWINNSNKSLGKTTFGIAQDVTGKPDGKIVSLGDSGNVILTFANPITNGTGPDFAVFENGILDVSNGKAFLEFAFVEVSSDGNTFFRFPATSNIPTSSQTSSFDYSDASLVNNLAGKYIINYGTPFDLEELKTIVGLNVSKITHVKIVDVVGSVDPAYGTTDKNGNLINDPWTTPFTTGGFDLEAVGVINELSNATHINEIDSGNIKIYPNPVTNGTLHIEGAFDNIEVVDVLGSVIITSSNINVILIENLSNGMYLIKATKGYISRYYKVYVSN
ncbi:MAG: T9SS type A sorting domain-containing protein [Bacteroidota bacterium]|nr:T9SS type A sorting domain-containing protein [Bacteroidota bacterium]